MGIAATQQAGPALGAASGQNGSRADPEVLVTDGAADGVTLVNGDRWSARAQQLAQLLATATPGQVIPDPTGATPEPGRLVTVGDAPYWAADPVALREALRDLTPPGDRKQEASAAAAVAASPGRLTLTVEEASALLGISRAFAYEAVRRGEIPSIRIGRRVLVPKIALERLVGGDAPGVDPGE